VASSATCRWKRVKFIQDTGFDGWEEASWELDLARCDTDAGAEAYAKERADLAKRHGLEIFTVATHLQGQALGDEPTAKTLQFVVGDAVKAYKDWRDSGHKPPRIDAYHVPEEVGRLIHKQAAQSIIRCARLSHHCDTNTDLLSGRTQNFDGPYGSATSRTSLPVVVSQNPIALLPAAATVLPSGTIRLGEQSAPVFDRGSSRVCALSWCQ
jgi:hypothetical protein